MFTSSIYKLIPTDLALAQSVIENLNKMFQENGSFYITIKGRDIVRLSFDAKSIWAFLDFSAKLKEYAKKAGRHIELDHSMSLVLNLFCTDTGSYVGAKSDVHYYIDKPTDKYFAIINRSLEGAPREHEESKMRAKV